MQDGKVKELVESAEAVLEQIRQVRTLLGSECREHDALFSTRILKKSGLRV